MKKIAFALVVFCELAAVGCHDPSAVSKSEEAQIRASMSKTKFNIKDVPEKDRERVKGIMRANGFDPETSQRVKH